MWAQWISVIGVIAGLITALFVAIGAWISVARKFDRIDSRFDRVEARFDLIEHAIDQIRVQGNGHLASRAHRVFSHSPDSESVDLI